MLLFPSRQRAIIIDDRCLKPKNVFFVLISKVNLVYSMPVSDRFYRDFLRFLSHGNLFNLPFYTRLLTRWLELGWLTRLTIGWLVDTLVGTIAQYMYRGEISVIQEGLT